MWRFGDLAICFRRHHNATSPHRQIAKSPNRQMNRASSIARRHLRRFAYTAFIFHHTAVLRAG
jgi:hypothetical protein